MHGYRALIEERESIEVWRDAFQVAQAYARLKSKARRRRIDFQAIWNQTELPHPRWNSFAALFSLFADRDREAGKASYCLVLDADNVIYRKDLSLQSLGSSAGLQHRSVALQMALFMAPANESQIQRHGRVYPKFQGSTILFRKTRWLMEVLLGIIGLSFGIEEWVPAYLWADAAIRSSLRFRVEYVAGVSGHQMNQNLWLAAVLSNWGGVARDEICGYHLPQQAGARQWPLLAVNLYCPSGHYKRRRDGHFKSEGYYTRQMARCFARNRRARTHYFNITARPGID